MLTALYYYRSLKMLPLPVVVLVQSHRHCCPNRCLVNWAVARQEALVVEQAQLRVLVLRSTEAQGRRRYPHYWIVMLRLVAVKGQLRAVVRMWKAEVLGR
jgi:hypothetical protein